MVLVSALLLSAVVTVVKKPASSFGAFASFYRLLRVAGASPVTESSDWSRSMVLLPLRTETLFATISLLLFKLSGIFNYLKARKRLIVDLAAAVPYLQNLVRVKDDVNAIWFAESKVGRIYCFVQVKFHRHQVARSSVEPGESCI